MTVGASIIRVAPRTAVVTEADPGRTTVIRPARTTVIQSPIPGPPGPQGPPGPGGGGGGGGFFTHTQMVASALWVVTHNLGYRPAVTVWDTANDQIQGDVDHIDTNTLTIGFSTAISGSAYMS